MYPGMLLSMRAQQPYPRHSTPGHIPYSGHLMRGIGSHVNGVVTLAKLTSLSRCSWHNTGVRFGMFLIFAEGHARARHQMLIYAGMQHVFERLASIDEKHARSLLKLPALRCCTQQFLRFKVHPLRLS